MGPFSSIIGDGIQEETSPISGCIIRGMHLPLPDRRDTILVIVLSYIGLHNKRNAPSSLCIFTYTPVAPYPKILWLWGRNAPIGRNNITVSRDG